MLKLLKAYIGYKTITLIISIILVIYFYNKFHYMFQFTFDMLKHIK